MRVFSGFLLSLAALGAFAKGQAINFDTPDGVTVYGEVYQARHAAQSAPLILLFHQGGGDARGEYGPLIPQLLEQGYHLLAIDQRQGGERFGGVNRTVAGAGDTEYGYCDAYPDLEGALQFARHYGFSGRIAVWGSSYSAALVFRLGAEHPAEIDAILAFSPASGSPMQGCLPDSYSARVNTPLLALRPASEMEVPYVPDQMRMFAAHGHLTHVADPGVHGSSMLDAGRVGASTEATWTVVLDFLSENLLDGE